MIREIQKLQEKICGSTADNKGLINSHAAVLNGACHSFFNGSSYKSTVSNHTVMSSTSTVSNSTVSCHL